MCGDSHLWDVAVLLEDIPVPVLVLFPHPAALPGSAKPSQCAD